MIFNPVKALLPLVIYLECVSVSTSIGLSNDAIKTTNSARVLLIRNSDRQHAIEEAASLSLDLPLEPTRREEVLGNQTTASLGYRPVSLASLTLHQREPRLAPADPAANDQTDSTTTNQTGDPRWTELYLPRIKPSWLNVSSQFKITVSSIEEVHSIMPAEYLLRPAFDAPILLRTKLGIVEGVRSIKFNKHLYTFLSVPYAKPPVGELRFKPPQPVERWDGVLQTTKWPPFCIQPSMTLASKSSPVHVLSQMMTEDCLYLNIWTPSLKFNKNHRRPVMVWLHGGAFQYGGSSVDENDGSALALLGDLVVVTLNYRISAFGFLNANNPRNGPNNVGILDQQLAMEWVQANIKQFGGDPQQVTLFGESAGGHSVGLHMISPKSQPLFKRAIMQSGVPISLLRSYDVNTDNKGNTIAEGVGSVMMAKRLKCYAAPSDERVGEEPTPVGNSTVATGTTMDSENESESESPSDIDVAILNDETLDCMRNKSSLEILKAMGSPGNAGFFPTGNDLKGVFPNGNIQESYDPDSPKIGPQKDYLIGTNTDEGTFMLHYGMPSVFPSRDVPKVSSIDALKEALKAEIERLAKSSTMSLNNSEIQSATGGTERGGSQAHLYKPLLRTSTSLLESFMPKPQAKGPENGTAAAAGNSSVYSKEIEFGRAIGSLITDIIFLCPARSLARTLSEAGRNVYFYLYTHRSSLSQYHQWIGVTHHDEVEYVFGRPLRMADVYSGKDIEMSQRMIKMWSHFAYTGQMLDQFGLKWPKYGEEEHNYMSLGPDQASIGQRYHDRFCNIYDSVISVHLQDN